MEQQISICNENGVQIGKTFRRRAKQLVIKSRAKWLDDKHSAICLLPQESKLVNCEKKEVEGMDSIMNINQTNDSYEPVEEFETRDIHEKDKLLRIAHKRVKERKSIVKNTLMYISAWLVFIVYLDNYYLEDFFCGFFSGGLILAGVILTRRIFIYLKPWFMSINIFAVLNRSDHDRVMKEYKRLKSMEPERVARVYNKKL